MLNGYLSEFGLSNKSAYYFFNRITVIIVHLLNRFELLQQLGIFQGRFSLFTGITINQEIDHSIKSIDQFIESLNTVSRMRLELTKLVPRTGLDTMYPCRILDRYLMDTPTVRVKECKKKHYSFFF